MFIDAKFYSIFSLLFGIGFAIQYESAKLKGADFVPYYRRRILHEALLQNITLLKKIAIWGLAIGLPVNILRTIWADGPFSLIAHPLGVVPLACGYAAVFALIVHRYPSLLAFFAAVGKTALSNYLIQSVICIILFYGIGFGWATKLSISQVLGVALLIVSMQILISGIWVRHFEYGPVEWAWKKLSGSIA